MDFILDDDDTTVVRLVGNQLIGRLKLDVVAITPELNHQISAPVDNARPTGNLVENLVDDVVGYDVEEVLARGSSPRVLSRSPARRARR
jgi:hypothetical protein